MAVIHVFDKDPVVSGQSSYARLAFSKIQLGGSMRRFIRDRVTDRHSPHASQPVLEILHERIVGSALAKEYALAAKKSSKGSATGRAVGFVEVANVLRMSRRVTSAWRIYMVGTACFGLVEDRHFTGQLTELEAISKRLSDIEDREGLTEDQYWPKDQGPADYNRLSDHYDKLLEGYHAVTFTEIGAPDVGQMFTDNRAEFDRQFERGRREFFGQGDDFDVIGDAVARAYDEAGRCYHASAYSAGIVMLASAIEGLLTLRCLRSPDEAIRFVEGKASRSILKWTLSQLLEAVERAGWMRSIETRIASIRPTELATLVRDWRNLVHPGRVAKDRPWQQMAAEDYEYAHAVFLAMRAALLSKKELKRLMNEADKF
jgi:hypothetical protein